MAIEKMNPAGLFIAIIIAVVCYVGLSDAAHAACVAPSSGSYAGIVQGGFNAHATVLQTEAANSAACINQGGTDAVANVIQVGSTNLANIADVMQLGGIGQRAYVEQDGDGNTGTVRQSQAQGATTLGSSSALAGVLSGHFDPGGGYAAVIGQTGVGNIASISQQDTSSGSYAEIGQWGYANVATTTQYGVVANGNFSSIFQTANGNNASITQNGDNLSGAISQTNGGNYAALSQTGNSLNYNIKQDGVNTLVNGAVTIFSPTTSISVSQTNAATNISLH